MSVLLSYVKGDGTSRSQETVHPHRSGTLAEMWELQPILSQEEAVEQKLQLKHQYSLSEQSRRQKTGQCSAQDHLPLTERGPRCPSLPGL